MPERTGIGDKVNMNNEQVSQTSADRPRCVNSLLGAGEASCDKCGKIIRHMDRYCCNTLECAICGTAGNTITERDSHFSQQHPRQPSRGARYCFECSAKAGYLKE